MDIKKEKSDRGFLRGDFEDLYGTKCSIQESSLATDDAIWLGVSDADPKIMASKTPEGGTGWVPFSIPEDVLLTTRMHLNREGAKKLIELLQDFVDTGSLDLRTSEEKEQDKIKGKDW